MSFVYQKTTLTEITKDNNMHEFYIGMKLLAAYLLVMATIFLLFKPVFHYSLGSIINKTLLSIPFGFLVLIALSIAF